MTLVTTKLKKEEVTFIKYNKYKKQQLKRNNFIKSDILITFLTSSSFSTVDILIVELNGQSVINKRKHRLKKLKNTDYRKIL